MSHRHQHIVGIHYALGPKIGEGSFGVIFEGENLLNKDSKEPVAIKFEPRNSDAPQLRDEFRAYRILNDCLGIPHAYYYGQEGMHNVLVIDLLGPSLEDLFEWCGRKFSVKTTCLLARQMIQRVRSIHEHDLIYRDIKPDNFLVSEFQLNHNTISSGSSVSSNRSMSSSSSSSRHKNLQRYVTASAQGDPNLIYMVDFGMAKQYRDPRTKQHIPYRERKSLSGTARYMSINTHFGREQSRRDDLESLGHVFFYFLRGSLPWQGLKAPTNKLKYEKIGLTKQKLDPRDLLLNGAIPEQFATYLKYARNLKFEEEPDYDYLIGLIDEVLLQWHLEDDGHYDWMDLNHGEGWNIAINKRANLHGYGNATPRNNNNNNNNNKNHDSSQPKNSDSNKFNRISQVSRTNKNTNYKNSRSDTPGTNGTRTQHRTNYDSMGTHHYNRLENPHDNYYQSQEPDENDDNLSRDANSNILSKIFSKLCCCCCCC